MDFDLPKEVQIIKRTVREFAEQTIAPLVPQMEETGQFPEKLLKAMGELGLLGLVTPNTYGGSNLGYLARTVAIEEIGRVCGAVGLALQVHHMATAALVDFGTADQKAKYLPPLVRGDHFGTCAITEPTGGSDLLGMASTAKPSEGGYVLTGRKCFITNAHGSGVAVIIAKTGEGPKGLSAFLVEKGTPGFSAGRREHKLGLHGADTGELILTDCKVPRQNLLGNEGEGMAVALKVISEVGRSGMAAVALGLLQAASDEGVKFAKERNLYGKPISQLQAIQWSLAEITMLLEASRLLCYRASWLKDKERDSALEATTAKAFVTEAAAQAAKKAMEIHGGCGTMMEYPIQRILRDALVCISAGGTTEVGKLVVARAALS